MKSPSRGFTLIELLVALSVGAFLMSLAIGALERAMSIDTSTKARLDEARNLNRLADQFRADVHLATDVSLRIVREITDGFTVIDPAMLNNQPQASIQSETGVITYTVTENHVERKEVMTDDRIRFERYSLGQNRVVSFDKLDEPNCAVLTVRQNTGLQHSPTRIDRVVAAVIGHRLLADASTGDAP